MPAFRTELHPAPASSPISLSDPLLALGSCFADQIGAALAAYRLSVMRNPFGVLFNPVAVSRLLTAPPDLPEAGFVRRDERSVHLFMHSALNAESPAALRKKIEERHQEVRTLLPSLRYVLLTWGTAWVYEDQETGAVVANCHKQPAKRFRKRLLEAEEIRTATVQLLTQLPPQAQVILTVSPVRHLRDTLPLNAVSKSLLRVAAHELSERYERIHYFPAYELLLDDLRDYRFFDTDLLHPSKEAVEYIREKFFAAWLDTEAQAFVRRWAKIQRKLAHRPFNPDSQAHQQFIARLREEVQAVSDVVDVSDVLRTL